MNVIAIVMIVALVGLVTWLLVDTIIYFVKKVKLRKQKKVDKESQDTSN